MDGLVATVYVEKGFYVAHAHLPNPDLKDLEEDAYVSSQGKTMVEAIKNLAEAIELVEET